MIYKKRKVRLLLNLLITILHSLETKWNACKQIELQIFKIFRIAYREHIEYTFIGN